MNKETLQSYNTRLNNNNVNLDTILETINNLPEAGTTEQSNEYIQDGLIAWFDGRDELDANGHWNSRVGDDYFMQSYPTNGTQMVQQKTSNSIASDGTFIAKNQMDYLKEGYTIEVCCSYNEGEQPCFFTFDKNQSALISIAHFGMNKLAVINLTNGAQYYESGVAPDVTPGFHTFSLNLFAIAPRGVYSYQPRLQYSIDGNHWKWWGFTATTKYTGGASISDGASYKSNSSVLFGYYNNQYPAAGTIYSVRIYNRALMNSELEHNANLDKKNFNL